MNNYNGQKEEKGGFWSALSGLFRGGASSMGSASSGAGGIFATKAGIMGMVLGGATIAAGVGVVYNFVGPSSKPVYSPELFQNSYYEEEASAASQERAQSKDRSSASASTLDMFSEQAKKDGLSGLASEGAASEEKEEEASASAEAPAADAPDAAAVAASGAMGGSGEGSSASRLKPSSGFGGSKAGGGSSSTMPRIKSAGGLSGGIGGQFSQMYRAPAGQDGGRTSGMSAMAARAKSSPKYSVPNFNKKGAHAQAKFAGSLGAKAAYSSDAVGARTSASEAFVGETGGEGDVVAAGEGAGMGGAGIAGGSQLKANDPNINNNQSSIPQVTEGKNDDPWQKDQDDMMKNALWALGMLVTLKALTALAKAVKGTWMQYAVMIAATIAIGVAIWKMIEVFKNAFKIYNGVEGSYDGQKMMGGMYIAAGVMLSLKLVDAYMECMGTAGDQIKTNTQEKVMNDVSPEDSEKATKDQIKADNPSFDKKQIQDYYDKMDSKDKMTVYEKGADGKDFTMQYEKGTSGMSKFLGNVGGGMGKFQIGNIIGNIMGSI